MVLIIHVCFYIIHELQKESIYLKNKVPGYRQTQQLKQQRGCFYLKVFLIYLSTFLFDAKIEL